MTSLADRLGEEIRANGPISVERYMTACITEYYAAQEPFGRGGDFITAPEVSQMFGELIGAWMADLWHRAGEPRLHVVELGPGRGTLMADALRAGRAMHGFVDVIDIHLVETSPAMRAEQAGRLPGATWHDNFASVPDDGVPLMIVANEFFDVLPVRQWVRCDGIWHERRVDLAGGGFAFVPDGDDIRESSPARAEAAARIGSRLAAQGGAALVIDYGHLGPLDGDTLQAVRAHKRADPLATPGEADLTAQVDFTELSRAATGAGALASPVVSQGAFLTALGIAHRCERLVQGLDDEATHVVASAMRRLTAPQAMGELFKALALRSPGWPVPAGF